MDFTITGSRDELALMDEEGELLYGLVRALKPEVCFEIGTHKGVSTQYILKALIDNDKGHLTTTDPVDYGAENRMKHPRLTFLYEKGCDVKLANINFVFVDGFHTVDDVVPEIQSLLPQLAKDAIVVFHDAQDEPTNWEKGVNAAITKCNLKTLHLPTNYGLQIYKHETNTGSGR